MGPDLLLAKAACCCRISQGRCSARALREGIKAAAPVAQGMRAAPAGCRSSFQAGCCWVQPVQMSVRTVVHRKLPLMEPPQWATLSISVQPGPLTAHGPVRRGTWAWRVPSSPRPCRRPPALARRGAGRRSSWAALIFLKSRQWAAGIAPRAFFPVGQPVAQNAGQALAAALFAEHVAKSILNLRLITRRPLV